eukprot:2644225-Rhodomonas_salina.1
MLCLLWFDWHAHDLRTRDLEGSRGTECDNPTPKKPIRKQVRAVCTQNGTKTARLQLRRPQSGPADSRLGAVWT